MLDLTNFLNTTAYPHTAEIAVGGGSKLAITLRAADASRLEAAVLAAVGAGLTTLGLGPLVTMKAVNGNPPKGEALSAFTEALKALDADADAELTRLMQLADGAGLADCIGSWEAVLPGGQREAFSGEVSPETCAALPADMKKAILNAVNAAALPVEKLDFLGQSPASSPGARRGGSGKAGS